MKKYIFIFLLFFSLNVHSQAILDLSKQEFFYNSGMEIVCLYKTDIPRAINALEKREYHTWDMLVREQRCFLPSQFTFKIFPYMNRPIGNVGKTDFHAIYMDAKGSKRHIYCVNGLCDNDMYVRKNLSNKW